MSAIVVGTKIGKFIVLPNDLLGKKLISTREYEPHFGLVANSIIHPGSVCIDCGANLGYHTIKMAQLAGPMGRVFAFEPLRVICQQLGGNIFLNDLENVECFNVALGNKNEIVTMNPVDIHAPDTNIGATKVGSGGENTVMVKLDSFGFQNVSFIKMDVQGYELELLKGASETIDSSRPILFFETDEPYLKTFGTSSEELLNHILGLNYIIIRLSAWPAWDHIAFPKEKKDLIQGVMKDFPYSYDVIEGKSVKVKFDGKKCKDEVYGSFEVIK